MMRTMNLMLKMNYSLMFAAVAKLRRLFAAVQQRCREEEAVCCAVVAWKRKVEKNSEIMFLLESQVDYKVFPCFTVTTAEVCW